MSALADGLRHRHHQELVVVVEYAVFLVDGFQHADLRFVLHQRDQERIGDRRGLLTSGSRLRIARCQSLVVGIGNQQRLALLGHIRHVAFARRLRHADFNRGVFCHASKPGAESRPSNIHR